MANTENRVPVSKDTLFSINSATKCFTGVALMQLAEAGLVDLNHPIERYLDDLPPSWNGIRVRQLLAHTSGLPNIVIDGTEMDGWNAVKQMPMDGIIGEKCSYNQTNYGLLLKIIVRQSKMSFEQYVAERQFKVAGMRNATFGDSYDLVANSATNYSYQRKRMFVAGEDNRLAHWFDELPPGLRTGSGIQTTAEDLAKWLIALSKGQLISNALVREMWTPEKLNDGKEAGWGAGWSVLKSSQDLQVAGIGGARSAFIVYPDRQLAIVVLTNLVGANPEDLIPEIAKFYE